MTMTLTPAAEAALRTLGWSGQAPGLGNPGRALMRLGLATSRQVPAGRRGNDRVPAHTEHTITKAGRAVLDRLLLADRAALEAERAALGAKRAAEGRVDVEVWALRAVLRRAIAFRADCHPGEDEDALAALTAALDAKEG